MTTPLPDSALLARPLADPRSVLRMTGYDDDGSELPARADDLVGPRATPAKDVGRILFLLALSVAGVWFITVRVWDRDGFFPWFWNVVWLIFPWVFLGPFWASTIRGMRRRGGDGELHASWDAQRAAARHDLARVSEAVYDRDSSGGVAHIALRVDGDGVTSTIARLAPARSVLPGEVPQAGDTVHRFVLPSGRVIVQASRRRTPIAAPAAAEPVTHAGTTQAGTTHAGTSDSDAADTDGDLVAELERLAALHASGALDDAEYAAAKARLLA